MTLNPITALSEQLQKLITEHGSAAILRDHLALFKDQVIVLENNTAALEKKVSILEREKSILQTKVNKLESKSEQLLKDNHALRGQIQDQSTLHGKNTLDEIKVKILVFLATQRNDISTEHLASAISVNTQVVLFHLTELKKLEMVYDLLSMSAPTTWKLHHEGRRYLIEYGLIS